jgi:ESCRT-II complex subunit VPS36
LQKQQQLDNNTQDKDAQQHLASLLQDIGMTSALTEQDVTQTEHYEFLARQVADFLLPKLPQMGGILTLTDAFCLFNRARGTTLISPEDLAQACQLLAVLNLGISQRTFPSGVVLLQLDSKMGDSTQTELAKLCPTTALEASHLLKLSPLLAQEQLEEAESMALLCRDVTLETTRFCPNRFQEEW